MSYLLAALLGYFLGCSNLAYWLAKWYQVDFRKGGSGNLGASNATVLLDEERKAAMVSNLLVVLCGNKDAQPIVNSGSLY